jgi:hypothetical protein
MRQKYRYRSHRYLMTRLGLQVIYLWRHVSSTAPPFILWWWNLEILFGSLHRSSPFIGELRCQAIQMEHGTYIAERTQSAVYIVRCLWSELTIDGQSIWQDMDPVHPTAAFYAKLSEANFSALDELEAAPEGGAPKRARLESIIGKKAANQTTNPANRQSWSAGILPSPAPRGGGNTSGRGGQWRGSRGWPRRGSRGRGFFVPYKGKNPKKF